MSGPYKLSAANKRRGANGAKALADYTHAMGPGSAENGKACNLGDLLSDLMHFCIQNKIDFYECVDQAEMHIRSEREGRE